MSNSRRKLWWKRRALVRFNELNRMRKEHPFILSLVFQPVESFDVQSATKSVNTAEHASILISLARAEEYDLTDPAENALRVLAEVEKNNIIENRHVHEAIPLAIIEIEGLYLSNLRSDALANIHRRAKKSPMVRLLSKFVLNRKIEDREKHGVLCVIERFDMEDPEKRKEIVKHVNKFFAYEATPPGPMDFFDPWSFYGFTASIVKSLKLVECVPAFRKVVLAKKYSPSVCGSYEDILHAIGANYDVNNDPSIEMCLHCHDKKRSVVQCKTLLKSQRREEMNACKKAIFNARNPREIVRLAQKLEALEFGGDEMELALNLKQDGGRRKFAPTAMLSALKTIAGEDVEMDKLLLKTVKGDGEIDSATAEKMIQVPYRPQRFDATGVSYVVTEPKVLFEYGGYREKEGGLDQFRSNVDMLRKRMFGMLGKEMKSSIVPPNFVYLSSRDEITILNYETGFKSKFQGNGDDVSCFAVFKNYLLVSTEKARSVEVIDISKRKLVDVLRGLPKKAEKGGVCGDGCET